MKIQIRPVEQIGQRLDQLFADPYADPFGWAAEVLIGALTLDQAKRWLADLSLVPDSAWIGQHDVRLQYGLARGYYKFALEKVQAHRGLSASRSTTKLAEWAWLLGQDELVGRLRVLEQRGYAPYGAPLLREVGEWFRWGYPTEGQNYPLWRMGQGWPCRPTCSEGCKTGEEPWVTT